MILILIMISSIMTSFGGKYLSNKIVSENYIKFVAIVYGDKSKNPRQDGD
jgi:hypothetical protein